MTSCHQVELELHKAVTLAKNNFLLMQLFQMSVLNSPVNQHQVVRAPQVAGAGRGGVGLRLAETLGAPWRHIPKVSPPESHLFSLSCSLSVTGQMPARFSGDDGDSCIPIEPLPTLSVNNMEVKHNVSHMRPVADKYWRPPVALDCHFKTR